MSTKLPAAANAANIPVEMVAAAERLAAEDPGKAWGGRPVIGWFATSPRRGSFGIRFQVEVVVVDLGLDGTFHPVRSF